MPTKGKANPSLAKSYKQPGANALGSRPNKGGAGNPSDYNAARGAFKQGTMFKGKK